MNGPALSEVRFPPIQQEANPLAPAFAMEILADRAYLNLPWLKRFAVYPVHRKKKTQNATPSHVLVCIQSGSD